MSDAAEPGETDALAQKSGFRIQDSEASAHHNAIPATRTSPIVALAATVPLETERLVLRAFVLEDAPLIAAMVSAREVAEGTLNIPHPYPLEMAEQWVASRSTAAMDDSYHFAITRRNDGMLMGSIGIGITRRFLRAEIGYWLGVPFWNLGYATEAGRAVLRWGFQEFGLHKICASHFPSNPASGRVMQKLGMTYEGTLRQHVRRDGEDFVDLVYYGVLRDEFL